MRQPSFQPSSLRPKAEGLASALPALLASAEALAATITLGEHGRRQAGTGEAFWQFRPAQAGDPLRRIDWRRSARGDQTFVRETEWQAAQSVMLWVDPSASMAFASQGESKAQRGQLLALAAAILLLKGGERVGLLPEALPPRAGRLQLERLLEAMAVPTPPEDHTPVPTLGYAAHGRAVLVSDFLADPAGLEAALAAAADRGVRGVLLQVLDPAEEDFPFEGRTLFQSMTGALAHETQQAGALRRQYLDRLAARKTQLAQLARHAGWHYLCHRTDHSAQAALLWLHRALERQS